MLGKSTFAKEIANERNKNSKKRTIYLSLKDEMLNNYNFYKMIHEECEEKEFYTILNKMYRNEKIEDVLIIIDDVQLLFTFKNSILSDLKYLCDNFHPFKIIFLSSQNSVFMKMKYNFNIFKL